MNDGLERMWKKAGKVCFKVLPHSICLEGLRGTTVPLKSG